MTGRDIILFVSTFFLGMFVGAYVYVLGFAPNYTGFTGPQSRADAVPSEFEIVGEVYGGCARIGCGAYRLEANRNYIYTEVSSDATDTFTPVTGRLSQREFADLAEVLSSNRLTRAAEAVVEKSCSSSGDALDYRFVITLKGIEYDLDTCRTKLDTDEELRDTLVKVFDWIR